MNFFVAPGIGLHSRKLLMLDTSNNWFHPSQSGSGTWPMCLEATFFHAKFEHHKPGKVTYDQTRRQPSFGQWGVLNNWFSWQEATKNG